jgi:hypothetical protein
VLDQEGVAGYRQRLEEVKDRRRALTALNEQEFAANPARLRANRAAIETHSTQKRAAVDAGTLAAGGKRRTPGSSPGNAKKDVTPTASTGSSKARSKGAAKSGVS